MTGLVLAGGRSRRMGQDKGTLRYGNTSLPQVVKTWHLLQRVCAAAYVSINADQTAHDVYSDLPVIVDTRADRGPLGGLLSAFEAEPATAWLVLAVDMPRVSVALLRNLITQRDPTRIATVHCHADGTLEPLCAIWEPHCRNTLLAELQDGRGSLRAVAEREGAAVARLPEPEKLQNANTPDERRELEKRVANDDAGSEGAGRGGA